MSSFSGAHTSFLIFINLQSKRLDSFIKSSKEDKAPAEKLGKLEVKVIFLVNK